MIGMTNKLAKPPNLEQFKDGKLKGLNKTASCIFMQPAFFMKIRNEQYG